jgi:hypothetical protein
MLLAMASVPGCKSPDTVSTQPIEGGPASFAMIQSHVFTPSCTQCHNSTDARTNGSLNLTGDSAYANLVNALSFHPGAAGAGLGVRVMSGHPEKSFLVSKLTGLLYDSLGARMPKDGHPISDGKVEFIRRWITAGAPKTGAVVADTALLNDQSEGSQAPIAVLAQPAQGFQLHLEPFEVPAGSEREVFIYKKNPMTSLQFMSGVQISMREGSHHFILWNIDGAAEELVEGAVRDRTDDEMKRDRVFVNGSQTLLLNFKFPEGIAVPLPPQYGFDFNSHYVNPSSQMYHGEAYVNVNTIDASKVQHQATPFLWADTDFQIPGLTASYTRKYKWPKFTKLTHMLLLSSHAHKRMLSFKIYKNGPTGELIYSSEDWHEPPVETLSFDFQPGEQLYSETTWANETTRPIRFGYTTEDEMNVIFGYYWQ